MCVCGYGFVVVGLVFSMLWRFWLVRVCEKLRYVVSGDVWVICDWVMTCL